MRWPEVIVVGIFFAGLAAVYLYGFLTTADVIDLDAAGFLLGIFILLMVIFGLFTSRFEFYDDGFVRKYAGKVRQQVNYSEVGSVRYFQGRRTGSGLLINAYVSERSLPFVIRGNPMNRELGIRLSDWLKTKVRDVD